MSDDRAMDLVRSCVHQLDDALGRRPAELGEEVDLVERELARLRDHLIERLRAEGAGGGAQAGRRRAALDTVNTALSLVVGVEYPAAGLQRQALEQAADLLRGLLDAGSMADAA